MLACSTAGRKLQAQGPVAASQNGSGRQHRLSQTLGQTGRLADLSKALDSRSAMEQGGRMEEQTQPYQNLLLMLPWPKQEDPL